MNTWRILSDNLIGALETAAVWGNGDEITVFLDATQESKQAVQALVTGSRDASESELNHQLGRSLNWFTRGSGAFKKTDVLLRGNSLTEIAWLMRSGRFTAAILAHANPAQGRFTAQGRYWMASPNQPYSPRSHEHGELLDQALERVGLSVHIPSRLDECLHIQRKVLVPDLLSQADLDEMATLSTQPQAA